jgi:hypothetical protein
MAGLTRAFDRVVRPERKYFIAESINAIAMFYTRE